MLDKLKFQPEVIPTVLAVVAVVMVAKNFLYEGVVKDGKVVYQMKSKSKAETVVAAPATPA